MKFKKDPKSNPKTKSELRPSHRQYAAHKGKLFKLKHKKISKLKDRLSELRDLAGELEQLESDVNDYRLGIKKTTTSTHNDRTRKKQRLESFLRENNLQGGKPLFGGTTKAMSKLRNLIRETRESVTRVSRETDEQLDLFQRLEAKDDSDSDDEHPNPVGRDEHLDAFLGKTASWVKQDLTAQATAQRLLLAK